MTCAAGRVRGVGGCRAAGAAWFPEPGGQPAGSARRPSPGRRRASAARRPSPWRRNPAARSPRSISRFRACCTVHAPSGCAVTPGTCRTRERDPAEVAVAGYVAAFGVPAERPRRWSDPFQARACPDRVARVRIMEYGCADGSVQVLFDGTPAEAEAAFRDLAAPGCGKPCPAPRNASARGARTASCSPHARRCPGFPACSASSVPGNRCAPGRSPTAATMRNVRPRITCADCTCPGPGSTTRRPGPARQGGARQDRAAAPPASATTVHRAPSSRGS